VQISKYLTGQIKTKILLS